MPPELAARLAAALSAAQKAVDALGPAPQPGLLSMSDPYGSRERDIRREAADAALAGLGFGDRVPVDGFTVSASLRQLRAGSVPKVDLLIGHESMPSSTTIPSGASAKKLLALWGLAVELAIAEIERERDAALAKHNAKIAAIRAIGGGK